MPNPTNPDKNQPFRR